MLKNKWELKDLPELKVGDCLAFEAEGWQRIVWLVGGRSFHWGMVGRPVIDDELSKGDYQIIDSTSKGTTNHLLSEYQGRGMRVYRPRMQITGKLAKQILKRCYYYGCCQYDYFGVANVFAWCLLRMAGFKVAWWESKLAYTNTKFWCLELDEQILDDFGLSLIPDDEPAYPYNMENSKALRLIWGTY